MSQNSVTEASELKLYKLSVVILSWALPADRNQNLSVRLKNPLLVSAWDNKHLWALLICYLSQWAKSHSQICMPGFGYTHSSFETVMYSRPFKNLICHGTFFYLNLLLPAAPQLCCCTSIRMIPQCSTWICALKSERITQLGKTGAPELIQGKDQDTEPWSSCSFKGCFCWKNSALCCQLYSLAHQQILSLISSLFNSKCRSDVLLLFMSAL